MKYEDIRRTIVKAGVNNLRAFGYEYADEKTLLTDPVHMEFFKSMLKNNLGKGNKQVDKVIEDLIKEVSI